MTLVIAWIGVDQKKNGNEISSVYLASDSRYSWGNAGKYDYGIKVFGSTKYPEIFGFCGDVLFPSAILGQIIPQIDNGILINHNDTSETKNDKISNYIKSSFATYPKGFLVGGTFTILHATRCGKEFSLYETTFNENEILNKKIELPLFSTKVFSGGKGGAEFDNNWLYTWRLDRHNNFRTSRAVYHCLHFTLKTIKDPSTGGRPQIVGLYREKNARLFGIVENEKRYIFGKESSEQINSSNIEWRNENFERVNPETLKLFEGAQRQPS